VDVLKLNRVFLCLFCTENMRDAPWKAWRVPAGRAVCIRRPFSSAGTHTRVQGWLHGHREGSAEAARLRAVCAQTRRLREGFLCQALCRHTQGGKRRGRTTPMQVPGPSPGNQQDHGAVPGSDTLTVWMPSPSRQGVCAEPGLTARSSQGQGDGGLVPHCAREPRGRVPTPGRRAVSDRLQLRPSHWSRPGDPLPAPCPSRTLPGQE